MADRKTLAERIEESGLKMTATETPMRPPAWADGMDGWRCTLKVFGRRMTLHFWMGLAHGGRRPEAIEVVEALCLDAWLIEEYADAEEFQRGMGYENAREAAAAYVAATKQTERFRRLLGDEFEQWIYETEPL